MNTTKEFIITLFLGWFGVHKFIKKKYLLGAVYFVTLGGFGVLWVCDTIIAFFRIFKPAPSPAPVSPTISPLENKTLVKSFDTVIVGTFAKCVLDDDTKREDLIMYVRPKWELFLQPFTYKGEPAFYVCHPDGSDLGCVRAGLSKIIYEEYSDCDYKVTALESAYDDRNDVFTFNIRIDIFR